MNKPIYFSFDSILEILVNMQMLGKNYYQDNVKIPSNKAKVTRQKNNLDSYVTLHMHLATGKESRRGRKRTDEEKKRVYKLHSIIRKHFSKCQETINTPQPLL